ncbi:MAG: hypothetical protein ACRELG_17600, partial [Gemmataceae bacterium]
ISSILFQAHYEVVVARGADEAAKVILSGVAGFSSFNSGRSKYFKAGLGAAIGWTISRTTVSPPREASGSTASATTEKKMRVMSFFTFES